jgi:hypothetical protein
MPTPSTTNTSTPPRLSQIAGQSNLDGFVRLKRSLMETNDHAERKNNNSAHIPPLLRKRRIRDDDDDVPMINSSLPTSTLNPVVIADTENESDANGAVILPPQLQSSHEQSAAGSKPRKSQSWRPQLPAPAEFAVAVRPV